MQKLEPATFKLQTDLIRGLKAVKARDGIPQSVQVRQAVREYLEEKGVMQKPKTPGKKRA